MKTKVSFFLSVLLIVLLSQSLFAQKRTTRPTANWLSNIELQLGTEVFDWENHQIKTAGSQHLAFEYFSNKEEVLVRLYPEKPLNEFALLPSENYKLLDTIHFVDGYYYSFRVAFTDLAKTKNLQFIFEVQHEVNKPVLVHVVDLFPYTKTKADFYPMSNELFLGEVQRFELESNQIENIRLDGLWNEGDYFNYRLAFESEKPFVFIEPKKVGEHEFSLAFPLYRPILDTLGQPKFELPVGAKTFSVKNSRYPFVRIIEREVVRDPNALVRVELTLENNRYIKLNQLYRVESSEQPNSPLVAEILPLRRLSNDKILCEFRPIYNHAISDGFLYVKDETNLLFLTNIEIRPKPSLKKVLLLQNGSDWSGALNVKPGQRFTLRIEGSFLKNAKFAFPELEQQKEDTIQHADNFRLFHLQVPLAIEQKKVNVLMNGEPSSIEIQITEHQTPRPLDFIEIDYGEGMKNIGSINQPILYPRTVSDVTIHFDREKIDEADKLYGKQHIRVRVRMEDNSGSLIETATLGPFWGCPDETALRYQNYETANCRKDEIRLNDFLNRKTTQVREWGRIEITFEHVSTSYSTEGYSKRIVIYNERRTTFDVDVSIPAGLFIQKLGADQDLASLSGISFAMVAQFSFYRKNEIQQTLPFKLGAGFLALNTFNFQPEANRDLGLVVLGSVYPVKTGRKISFPLYVGGGYFLQEGKFFVLVGPGIRITL